MLSIFSCVFWPCIYLLWKNVNLSLVPISFFFFNIDPHKLFIYVLEINPLSVASFANIFSHSGDFLFVLFMIFFAVKRLLSLIKSFLFCFFFSLP